MLGYIGRRVLQIIPLLIGLSLIIFFVIQLPPGDYVSMQIQNLRLQGTDVAEAEVDRLMRLYDLDRPFHEQYLRWIGRFVQGNFGRSMERGIPVTQVIGDRLALTMVVSLLSLAFTWAISIPAGIYSATHQYSSLDYIFTFLGFLGISVPGFLIALVILFLVFSWTGTALVGLFSSEFIGAPWSWPKVVDLLKHVWLPMIILGISGTASLIRIMRGMMLDELQKQYVITARAKGLSERRLLFKYPVRMAINPIISTIGWLLPALISGEVLVSVVMNLPTMGPLILRAIMAQDMPLAGSFLMISSTLAVFGTLVSDILLAYLDPRIRFGGVTEEA